jgi:hypothetical protein
MVAANGCSWLLQLMVADICRTAGCSSSGISSEKDVYKCRRLLGDIMKLKVHKREKFFGSDFEFFTIL